MRCCFLMKQVFDSVYSNTRLAENRIDKIFIDKFTQLNNYAEGLSRGLCPDHSDPWTRLAFAYRYLAARTCQIEHAILNELPRNYLLNDNIVITSVGCGPGTDLLGVIKARRYRNSSAKIHAYMLDSEKGWKSTFCDFLASAPELKAQLAIGPITTEWIEVDFSDSGSWPFDSSYEESDLFILSYVLSEVCNSTRSMVPFVETLFKNAKDQSAFIIIDNNHSDFTPIYNETTAKARTYNIELEFSSSPNRWYPGSEEQKSDLEPYVREERLNSRPLMQANFVTGIGIKR